jgi:hypothetical protein
MTDIDIKIDKAPYQRHINFLRFNKLFKRIDKRSYWSG